MPQKFVIGIVIFAVGLVVGSLVVLVLTSSPVEAPASKTENQNNQPQVFLEKISGSKNHSPDGTWWGYNQSKIVRFDDTVFMYVIENDDKPKTPSNFTIYKKVKDINWVKGASFPTSRPGNILIDSKGVLHAFVFEATDMKNDSIGKLMHYWFPASAKGDIENYKSETIVGAKKDTETVNIRVGAAIGKDDTMAVAFGLTVYEPDLGQTEQLYFKRKKDTKWTKLIAGKNLGHDWYYPFTLVSDKGFHLLPVQDDFVAADEQNIYQKIMYLERLNGKWSREILVDLSVHDLAKSRRRLLEQSEFFEDSTGKIHIIYKEFLDPSKEYTVSSFTHLIKDGEKEAEVEIDFREKNINWIRLVEVEGKLYYIATSHDQLFVAPVGSKELTRLDVSIDQIGIYPYVASEKSGTQPTEKFVDISLLAGDGQAYPNSSNYYVRIPKSEFSKVK